MKNTSQTHPLRIDCVQPVGVMGKIGMTLCPGKVQSIALSGQWERDLVNDLMVIQSWGATMLISLMEPHEFTACQVECMDDLMPADIKHYILPIVDGGIPSAAWERKWQEVGPLVRCLLRDGEHIVIHCLGGLGRTGLLAARLLVEFGEEPRKAIARVRKARRGAIETRRQQEYVLRQRAACDFAESLGGHLNYDVDSETLAQVDGCLVGGAVGDSLGAPVEFLKDLELGPGVA